MEVPSVGERVVEDDLLDTEFIEERVAVRHHREEAARSARDFAT